MAVNNWLIDKSALSHLHDADDKWLSRIHRCLVRISTVTLLEIGFSTRNGADHRDTLEEPPVSSMPVENLTPAIEARAVEIQRLLADRGQHRAPSIPDLLIAATAELSRLTVLHVDKDFDLIAAITGVSLVSRIDAYFSAERATPISLHARRCEMPRSISNPTCKRRAGRLTTFGAPPPSSHRSQGRARRAAS